MVGFVPMRSEQRVEARSALKYISAPHKLYQPSSSQHSPHTPTTNMAELDRIPPSTTTYVIATAIIAGISGYFLGQGASLGLFSSKEKEGWPNSYNVKVHRGSSDEEDETEEEESEEEEGDGSELANFENNNEEVKLVLVVRTDLGMTKGTGISFLTRTCSRAMDFQALNGRYQRHEKQQLTPVPTGKIAAQCSHATLACYKYLVANPSSSTILRRWERQGQAKIALQTKSEEEMELLQAQAISLGLCARVIQDAGRTQIASGSRTVLGVLGPKSVVDNVTGHLKLL